MTISLPDFELFSTFSIAAYFLSGIKKNTNLVQIMGKSWQNSMTESKNSMSVGKFVMFHNFSITIFIFQVFQSQWEP